MGINNNVSGFTLVELIITLVIATLLITVGAPSMTSLYEGTRADAGIRKIQSSLVFARSQAVSYGARVTVCPMSNGSCSNDWEDGFSIFIDRNTAQSIDGDDRVIKVIEEFNSSDFINFGADFVSFSPDGLIINNPGRFTYCPGSKTNPASLAADVSASGHVKFVDSDISVTCT